MGSRAGPRTRRHEPNLVMPEAITFLTIYLNPLSPLRSLAGAAKVNGQLAIPDTATMAGGRGGSAVQQMANKHTYDAGSAAADLDGLAGIQCSSSGGLPAHLGLPRYRVACAAGRAYQAHLIAADPLNREKAVTPTLTPACRHVGDYGRSSRWPSPGRWNWSRIGGWPGRSGRPGLSCTASACSSRPRPSRSSVRWPKGCMSRWRCWRPTR